MTNGAFQRNYKQNTGQRQKEPGNRLFCSNIPAIITAVLLLLLFTLNGCQGAPRKDGRPHTGRHENLNIRQSLQSAEIMISGKKFKNALKVLNKVLQKQPDNTRALLLKSRALEELGKLKQSEFALDELLNYDDNNEEAWLRKAALARKKGSLKNAVKYASVAVRKKPGSILARLELGRLLNISRRYQEAEKAFTKALKLTPQKAQKGEILIGRAYARDHLEKFDRAIEDLKEVIRLDYKKAYCHHQLRNIYVETREYAHAIKAQENYEKLDPDKKILQNMGQDEKALYYRNLGCIHQFRGEFPKAIENFDRSIRLRPENRDGYMDRGYVLFIMGRMDEARADMQKWLDSDPPSNTSYHMRDYANAYNVVGNYKMAVKSINRAMELDPENKHLLVDRAIFHYNYGNEKGFVKDFRATVKLADKASDVPIISRAMLEMRKYAKGPQLRMSEKALKIISNYNASRNTEDEYSKAMKKARRAFAEKRFDTAANYSDRALLLKKNDLNALLLRAASHYQAGRTNKALSDYEKANRLHPGDPRTYLDYARALQKAGMSEKALKTTENALKRFPNDKSMKEAGIIRAQVFLALEKYPQSQKELKTVLKTDPDNSYAHFLLADAYLEQGRLKDALKTLEYYRKTDPDFQKFKMRDEKGPAKYYSLKAHAQKGLGDIEQSVKNYNRAIRLSPEEPDNYLERGIVLYLTGKKNKAREDAKEWLAHKIPSETSRQLENHAYAQLLTGKNKRALNLMNRAMEKNPSSVEFYLDRAIIGHYCNKKKQSQKDMSYFLQNIDNDYIHLGKTVQNTLKPGRTD